MRTIGDPACKKISRFETGLSELREIFGRSNESYKKDRLVRWLAKEAPEIQTCPGGSNFTNNGSRLTPSVRVPENRQSNKRRVSVYLFQAEHAMPCIVALHTAIIQSNRRCQ